LVIPIGRASSQRKGVGRGEGQGTCCSDADKPERNVMHPKQLVLSADTARGRLFQE